MESFNETITTAFIGSIDTDTADRYLKDGDYRQLKNGIIDQQSGDRFAVKKIRSTKSLCNLNINVVP